MKVPRDTAELSELLQEQLQFLMSSCEDFDRGNESEAKRLALAIRILVKDTRGKNKQTSLLAQLGMKEQKFLSSTSPRSEQWPVGLVAAEISLTSVSETKFVPLLLAAEDCEEVTFDEWWEGEVIHMPGGGSFTRSKIVLALADQDGGAHVDPHLRSDYESLTRRNALRIYRGDEPMPAPHLATVRQIAHELLILLVKGYKAPAQRERKAVCISWVEIKPADPPAEH